MQLKRSHLRLLIENTISEAKRPGESLADLLSRLGRRHKIADAGGAEPFMDQYYVVIKDSNGGIIDKIDYRAYNDEMAWEEAVRIKSERHAGDQEYQIMKATEDGTYEVGTVF